MSYGRSWLQASLMRTKLCSKPEVIEQHKWIMQTLEFENLFPCMCLCAYVCVHIYTDWLPFICINRSHIRINWWSTAAGQLTVKITLSGHSHTPKYFIITLKNYKVQKFLISLCWRQRGASMTRLSAADERTCYGTIECNWLCLFV